MEDGRKATKAIKMSKNDKYIIAYGIGIGFFLTMFGFVGFNMLFAPFLIVRFAPPALVVEILVGIVGMVICIVGIYRRTKNPRGNKDE